MIIGMKPSSKYRSMVASLALAAAITACKHGQIVDNLKIVQSVTVNPISASILVGATAQFVASVDADPGATRNTTWSSSNPAVATVNSDGLVTGVAAGVATVTATATADVSVSGSASVTVTAPGITSIGVAPSSVSVTAGGTQSFTATVTGDPGVDLTVTWSSSNAAVATVSPTTGVAAAIAAGTASITATSNFDHTHFASGTLIVTAPSFTSINGTYTGAASLTTNTATPGTLGLLPTCAGSSTEYSEGILLSFNAAGVGTAAMMDATSFPRSYSLTMNAMFMATASGTFPFSARRSPAGFR